jgi:hypothetical protein
LTEAQTASVKKIPKITPTPSGPTNSILKNTDSSSSTPDLGNANVSVSSPVTIISPRNVHLTSTLQAGLSLGTPMSESSHTTSSSSEYGTHPGLHDYSYHHGLSVSGPTPDRIPPIPGNSEDENEMDENTTGTGSDTSSFKWVKH